MSENARDWDDVSIADLGEVVAGGTPSRAIPSFWNGSIPWTTPGEITGLTCKYVWDTREKITEDGLLASAAKVLPVGSLLVTTRATLGEVAIAAVPVTTNQGFKSIVPNALTDSLFGYYLLRSLRTKMERLASGTTFLEISKADFARIRTLRPLRSEQERIGAVLDTVDLGITKAEAVITKLKQVREGLLQNLLTRGLDKNGRLRDPATHPEEFQESRLGVIPVDWHWQSLEDMTEPHSPICYGIVQVFDFVPDGVPVLAIRDLVGDYVTGIHRTSKVIDANYVRSRVRGGDVLISIKGTIGRIGIVPSQYEGNISRDLARIRPAEGTDSMFLLHLLRSPIGQRTLNLAQVGTTRAELSIAPLKRLRFAVPKLTDEQKLISRVLNRQDELIAVSTTESLKLKALKSGLVADLITGDVPVPECLFAVEAIK
jgi:type I restriction enzyme S subunit